jgi:predicted membrane-bound dolichyl-phosphate-mannose-protein mannosyltransferase
LYDRAFIVLLVVDIVLRVIWLDKPKGSLIFDEFYYVNVARVILGLPQSLGSNNQPPYANAPIGLDPNHEHPPLAKLLIALSMHFLGDNGYGWRIPSVIFGSIGVLVFYLLMKRTAKYKMVPLAATFLFSFENLTFVHSRIATLDIFTLTFMMLGFYWYFSGHKYLSALGMTLSTLTKMTGAAGIVVIAIVHGIKVVTDRSKPIAWDKLLSWFEGYFAVYAVSFLLLLTLLDRFFTIYPNALAHLQFILNYSTGLTSSCPNGIISCPWQWLINQVRIPYLIVTVTSGSIKYDSIAFWGEMNPAILYLTIPAIALYGAYDYYEKKNDFALFTIVWFAVTYLPFYPAVIFGHRVTYLFYFLLTMPAVCAGVAHMIADQNPPKVVVVFYLAVVLFSFYMLFPFKVIPS